VRALYFVRHGESELNRLGRFAGSTDTPLSAKGRQQALEVGRAVRALGVDCVVSSPLVRAIDTATAIADEISYPRDQISVSGLLRERDFGVLEGAPWSPGLALDRVSGAESADTLLERAYKARAWLDAQVCDRLLIVSHGAFGLALRKMFVSGAGFEDRSMGGSALAIPNCRILCWLCDGRV
jgi:probable phosphoglycerate mutase